MAYDQRSHICNLSVARASQRHASSVTGNSRNYPVQKAPYGRLLDTKQWSEMHNIALPEARLSFFGPDGKPIRAGRLPLIFNSLAAYVDHVSKGLGAAQCMHIISAGELEQASSDEVKAVFGAQDEFILKGTLGLVWTRGWGVLSRDVEAIRRQLVSG